MTIGSGFRKRLLAIVMAATGVGMALPAGAEVYTLAEEQRMADLRVTPAEVAEIRAAVPRIATFLNDVWSTTTQRNGIPYVAPRIGAYTATFEHPACGRIPVIYAAYCHRGNVVLYDPIFLAGLAKIVGRGVVGDGWFAVVVVIAHEWGHAVVLQTQPGVFRSRRMHEFAADCLAGAVTRLAANATAVGNREVNSAYRTMSVLGDDVTADQNRDNVRAGRGHGTGGDRQTAFSYGFDNGPGRCMTVSASR